MIATPSFRTVARPGALLRLAALLALTQFPLAPDAAALAPQDSTHFSWDFPREADEGHQASPLIANGKVYYAAENTSFRGMRARNFTGDLVFERSDELAQLNLWGQPRYGISADDRVYYLQRPVDNYYRARVVILGSGGTRLGDFGPDGVGGDSAFTNMDSQGSTIAVSPTTGRVYVSDEYSPSFINPNGSLSLDPDKKGLVRVFDRDGNYLHEFRTSGVLASTLEGPIARLLVRADEQGNDELFVVEASQVSTYDLRANFKVFGGDGAFRRLVTGGIFSEYDNFGHIISVRLSEDLLLFSEWPGKVRVFASSVSDGASPLASFSWPIASDAAIGFNGLGGVVAYGTGSTGEFGLRTYAYPNYSTFEAAARNAVPNPWVLNVTQRPGGGIVDLDYRVDDLDDATVTTALVGFADGVASLNNVLPLNTLLEGTAAKIGANQPSGQVQRVTWDAGADWNVDFGTLRVMALARDSRTSWHDVHLVDIPADGDRPAVTISRNVMKNEDFLVQFLWLVATRDPSVNLVDGVLFGTTGAYDGVILADGAASTPKGREFLLARDGLRIATDAEVVRAREGATPNFTVALQPPVQMHRVSPAGAYPDKINEFGIEAGNTTGGWYVARAAAQ